MKITVINGTEKHGVTCRLKELFLEEFGDRAEVTEFYLPRDCPNFCRGCVSCTLRGEDTCEDALYIGKIDRSLREADLIVMTLPCLCISRHRGHEGPAGSLRLPLDAPPSCPGDVWKAGGDHHPVPGGGGKIRGQGHPP